MGENERLGDELEGTAGERDQELEGEVEGIDTAPTISIPIAEDDAPALRLVLEWGLALAADIPHVQRSALFHRARAVAEEMLEALRVI